METAVELRMIIDKSLPAFDAISDEDWNLKPSPDKWSKKQILGHLTDSAQTNLRRFVVTQFLPNEKIIYHQDEWVDLQDYQGAEISDVITLWKSLNLQIARTISSIPEGKLQDTCDTGKDSVELHTLDFLITDYIAHMKHHLAQITPNTKY